MVGIGNELNGDDAAGVLAVRALQKVVENDIHAGIEWLLLEAGPAPESFTGVLRQFAPDLVLLVDAADFGAAVGEIAWVDWQQAEGMSASTHTLPVSLFGSFLARELGCRVALLGIQAGRVEFDAPLSPGVQAAVAEISRVVGGLIG